METGGAAEPGQWIGPAVAGGGAGASQQCRRGRGDDARWRGALVRSGVPGVGGAIGAEAEPMLSVGPTTKVYLRPGAIDLRRGYERLYPLVRTSLGQDPLSGHVLECPSDCTQPGAKAGQQLGLVGGQSGIDFYTRVDCQMLDQGQTDILGLGQGGG